MKYERYGRLIVPDTLVNRPYGWEDDAPNKTMLKINQKDLLLLINADVLYDINDATDLLIGYWEEEEIPYDKIDIAIKITEESLLKEKDSETRRVINDYLLKMLYLAKEKKTLLALYL